MTDTNQPMTAMVEYQIRPATTSMDEWLTEWNKRAEDALDFEPETSAYAAAINLQDESNVLVFERYEQGSHSLQAHIERPAHTILTDTMGARNMTKRRVMSTRFYDLPGFGWWQRPQPAPAAGTIIVMLGFRFKDDAQRATYVELMADHEAYCWENEPDTLIYSAGIAAADADRELDLLRGDLVFVMACTDMEAMDKHANDPRHLALGPLFTENGIDLEPKFMRTYRSTGQGYLWR